MNYIVASFYRYYGCWIACGNRIVIPESHSFLSSYEAIERCEMQLEHDWETTGGKS